MDDTVKFALPIDRPFVAPLHHKVKNKPRDYRATACEHHEIEVDKDARTVNCCRCGVSLDPIQCLVNLAYHEQRTDDRIEEIRKYNQQQADAAKRQHEMNKEQAQKRLPTLRIGDLISIGTHNSWCSGVYRGVENEEVIVGQEENPSREVNRYKVTEVSKLRVLKRAR